MGFKDIKFKVIQCLKQGRVYHEQRNNIDVKNLLAIGVLEQKNVATIIASASGDEYTHSPHHYDDSVTVHVIKTRYACFYWYIKWYFIDDNTVFISVHNQGVKK